MKNSNHDSNSLNDKRLRKHPFTVEDNYFNELTDNIMNAVDAEESDLKYNLHLRKSPFTTPNGYFEQLSNKIEGAIKQEPKSIPLYQQTWVRLASVAASAIILATLYFTLPKTGVNNVNLDGFSDEAIIEFLESENALVDELLVNLDEIDSILDVIYEDETGVFVDAIQENPELEYDFEYFEY